MDLADLTRDLETLRDDALASIAAIDDVAALEALEVDILGKKGRLTTVLRGIGALPARGSAARRGRRATWSAAPSRLRSPSEGRRCAGRRLIGASCGREPSTSRRRAGRSGEAASTRASRGWREIGEIFGQFGFVVYESPEIEDDLTNFQMLNIPPDHPARDLWDTLYVDVEGHLLRTHTSPGQIRVMQRPSRRSARSCPAAASATRSIDASPCLRVLPGRGLMVDEGTTMGDLKGLLDQFAKAMFGADKRTRFRPGYYPFTEPSVAFDVECLVCGGSGCPACGRSGWMTILGAGMVHPVVLRYGGLDPERYQGFAFGMGPERIKMLKHGITDLRLFLENDLRFLEQFR